MPLDAPGQGSPGLSRLEARLRRELRGEVLFDRFSRGRYCDRRLDLPDRAARGRRAARQARRRGGAGDRARGGSACIAPRRRHVAMRPDRGAALVLDCSKYMDNVVALDPEARRVRVEPGLVMERLNARLSRTSSGSPSMSRPATTRRSAA